MASGRCCLETHTAAVYFRRFRLGGPTLPDAETTARLRQLENGLEERPGYPPGQNGRMTKSLRLFSLDEPYHPLEPREGDLSGCARPSSGRARAVCRCRERGGC